MIEQVQTNNNPPKIIFSNGYVSASSSSFMSFWEQPMFINIEAVTKITIKNEVIDSSFWTIADEFFGSKTPKCTHLAFQQCTFPNGFAQFYHIPHTSISIVKCGLKDQDFSELFTSLNPYILQGDVDLSHNQIGQDKEGIRKLLSNRLPDIFILKSINFTGNPIQKHFIQQLQEQHSKRTEIIFEQNFDLSKNN